MANLVQTVEINNFKSVKHLKLLDCKRINLFIGRPNVGKSNILEALSLYSYMYAGYDEKSNLHKFIRYENETELFFDGNINDAIFVKANNLEPVEFLHYKGNLSSEPIPDNPFKSYFFPSPYTFGKLSLPFLLPPNGINLFKVLETQVELRKELSDIFQDYGLKLTFDRASMELKLLKETKHGEVFIVPFNSIADTLQRLVFYKTAIASNHDSILIFEEPEAHAYPPYISKITQDIVSSGSNQFFITTHSPYVVTDFLESAFDELSIFLVDFRNGETMVKRLDDAEMTEVYQFGVDLFFNTETFLPE